MTESKRYEKKEENPQKSKKVLINPNMMKEFIEEANKLKQTSPEYADRLNRLIKDVKNSSVVAWCKLGDCYLFGKDFKKKQMLAVSWYLAAAQSGNLVAQLNLAWCYQNGLGVEQNEKEAFKWCKLAAEGGYSKARARLGSYYQEGFGIKKDEKEALKWHKLAAEQEELYSQLYLYLYNLRSDQNPREIFRLLTAAADQGFEEAMAFLAMCYIEGFGTRKDIKEAMKYFQALTERGLKSAQTLINIYHGEKCEIDEGEKGLVISLLKTIAEQENTSLQLHSSEDHGTNDEKSKSKLINKYLDMAGKGDVKAQRQLGLYFLDDNQNLSEARKWFKLAAENEDKVAQRYLGICYEQGKGGAVDYKEAVKWYRKSSEQGDEEAQYRLGRCYDEGWGVDSDIQQAYRWFKASARQGHALASAKELELYKIITHPKSEMFGLALRGNAKAQRKLAIWYAAVQKNLEKAVSWFRCAAKNGDLRAQWYLASYYEHGWGVKENMQEAIRWYQESAKGGMVLAQERLNELRAEGFILEAEKDEKVTSTSTSTKPPRPASPTHSSASLFHPLPLLSLTTPSLSNPLPQSGNKEDHLSELPTRGL